MFTFFVRVQSRPAPNSFPLHSSHRPYLCVLLGDLSVYCLSTPLPLLAASLHFSTVHLYVREVCFICYMSFSFSSVSVTVSISISVSFRGECVCGIIIFVPFSYCVHAPNVSFGSFSASFSALVSFSLVRASFTTNWSTC